MNKHIIQAFVILIVILLGVSLISESNDKIDANSEIRDFEDSVSSNDEIENGSMANVNVIEEDSSNLISDVNSKVASIIVGGLNGLLNFGIKMIDGITN